MRTKHLGHDAETLTRHKTNRQKFPAKARRVKAAAFAAERDEARLAAIAPAKARDGSTQKDNAPWRAPFPS
jgi:hypothetical protein